jgi:hypothetical protein
VPVTIEVSAGPLINVDSDAKTTEVVAEIESWFRDPVPVNS